MTIGSEIADMLEREMEPAQGSPAFVWNGETYPCSLSTEENGAEWTIGGTSRTVRLTLFVRFSVLPTPIDDDAQVTVIDANATAATAPPRAGKKATRPNGRVYRVLDVTKDPERQFYRLRLGDEHSGK